MKTKIRIPSMVTAIVVGMFVLASCSKESIDPEEQHVLNSHNEASVNSGEVAKRPSWALISVTVTFGTNQINPHYAPGNGEPPILDCIGWGLCKIQFNGVGEDENLGYPKKIDDSLVIYFERSTLDRQGIGSFDNDRLEVNEEVLIEGDWIRDLGFPDGYLIDQGVYDVTSEKDYLIVRF